MQSLLHTMHLGDPPEGAALRNAASVLSSFNADKSVTVVALSDGAAEPQAKILCDDIRMSCPRRPPVVVFGTPRAGDVVARNAAFAADVVVLFVTRGGLRELVTLAEALLAAPVAQGTAPRARMLVALYQVWLWYHRSTFSSFGNVHHIYAPLYGNSGPNVNKDDTLPTLTLGRHARGV